MHWTGAWIGPRANLDEPGIRRIPDPAAN